MTYKFKIARRMASVHDRSLGLICLPLLLLLGACAGGLPTEPDSRTPTTQPPAPTPVPGWLNLQFTTPHANDGVVQLSVVGGPVDEVVLQPGFGGYAGVASGSARLVVTGALASGTVARIRVPDLNKATGYQVMIGQVAQRGSYALRSSTLGYRAEVVR